MIIVAGAGRCGTSLMMQTLDLLGIPIMGSPTGSKGHQLWQNYQNRNNIILRDLPTDKNPKGYYEVPLEYLKEFTKNKLPHNHKGKAIKFTAPEIVNVPPDAIESIIFCKRRDMFKSGKSMHLLAQQDYEYAKEHKLNNCFANMYSFLTAKDWQRHMEMFNRDVSRWIKDKKIKSKTVYFEDMLSNPEPVIKYLVDFFNLENTNISAALKNVEQP